MKIFLVDKRNWTTTDRLSGEKITGMAYIGFTPSGKPIRFTSLEDYVVYRGEAEFDPKRAQEINLITKLFRGEIKYQDGASYGKDEEEE